MKVPLSIPGRISVYRTKILSLLAIGSNETDPLRDFFVEHEIAHPEGLSSPITNIKVDMPQPHSAPCTTWFFRSLVARLRFMMAYLVITTVIFAVLMVISNVQAYSSILYAYLDPWALSKQGDMLRSMTETPGEDTVEATNATLPTSLSDVKKELENLHVEVRDNPISPEALKHKTLTIKRTIEMTPYENRLIIPKIAKNAPIVDIDAGGGFDFDHMENIFMKELEKGVVRYPGTATPEQNGNMFIFGHSSNYVWSEGSYNQIFALLPKLEKGDDIIVFYNQKKYTYVVREKKIVSPGDVKAIKNDKTKKEINLMTCYPIGTTLRRMIIFADLKE